MKYEATSLLEGDERMQLVIITRHSIATWGASYEARKQAMHFQHITHDLLALGRSAGEVAREILAMLEREAQGPSSALEPVPGWEPKRLGLRSDYLYTGT